MPSSALIDTPPLSLLGTGSPFSAADLAGSSLFSNPSSNQHNRQLDFSALIARSRSTTTPKSSNTDKPASPEDAARAAAEQFVALTLVQPILKQLRESNHAAPPFAPTQGERQFQSLADAQIAQQVVRAAHFPLVDRLARDMLERAQRSAPSALAPGSTSE